jgi:hypothetical protein
MRLTLSLVMVAAAFIGVVAYLAESSTASGAPHRALTRSSAVTPPKVLKAHRLKARPRAKPVGSAVKPSSLGHRRVFSGSRDGFALANVASATYPARTTDGGQHWTINGPQFHIDAADAPEAVNSVGIVNAHTYFAFGSEVADVTTNAGKSWWETGMSDGVAAVVAGPGGKLFAYVYGQTSKNRPDKVVVWQYVSSDGGRIWKYTTKPY